MNLPFLGGKKPPARNLYLRTGTTVIVTQEPGLTRVLGPLGLTLAGIGVIIGAGIYVLIADGARLAGNAVWLALLVSAIPAVCTCLSYAELSAMFPRAGAEYEYGSRAYGKVAGTLVGLLIVFTGVAGSAAVALGFAGYVGVFLPGNLLLTAVLLIGAAGIVLLAGVRLSVWIAGAFTIVEAGGLILVIVAGIPAFGRVDLLFMPSGIAGVFSAAAILFFAFQGFEEIVKFSEEVKSPERSVPIALLMSLVVSVVLYVAVAVAAVNLLGWERLSTSGAPFSEIAAAAWGPGGGIALGIAAVFATANTVLLIMLASSRILYGMARDRMVPALFAWTHPRYRTPWAAIVFIGMGAALFLLPGQVGRIAGLANFALFLTFLVINAAVIRLRFRDPVRKRPFVTPGSIRGIPVLPVAGMAFSLLMLLELGPEVIMAGAAIVAGGVALLLLTGRR